MKKRNFYTEAAYLLGVIFVAFGTALETYAGFGMSTVVAPAYLIHLKVVQTIPWFSFGVAEYCTQFCLLLLMIIVLRKFRFSYLFSFITAIIYGLFLDLFLGWILPLPDVMLYRIIAFAVGTLFVTAGVSFVFHTYISPEVYELFVSAVSYQFNLKIHVFKTCFDITCCLIALCLTYIFFGSLQGIGIGTVISALINGTLIGWFTYLFERHLHFIDGLPFRKYFKK